MRGRGRGRGFGRRGFGGPRGGFGRGIRGFRRGPLNRGLRGLMNVDRDDLDQNGQTSDTSVSMVSAEKMIAQMKELAVRENEEAEESPKTTKEDLAVIDKLADLLYKGFITQKEYDAKKRQILGL